MTEERKQDDAWPALVERALADYRGLSKEERVWYTVGILISEIYNGGVVQYYLNAGADDLPDCMKALDELGANDMKGILVEFNARVFPKGVPANLMDRNEAMGGDDEDDDEDLEDRAMEAAHRLEKKWRAYITRHALAG